MRKLCLSTKFPHQEIRWNYDILRSDDSNIPVESDNIGAILMHRLTISLKAIVTLFFIIQYLVTKIRPSF